MTGFHIPNPKDCRKATRDEMVQEMNQERDLSTWTRLPFQRHGGKGGYGCRHFKQTTTGVQRLVIVYRIG